MPSHSEQIENGDGSASGPGGAVAAFNLVAVSLAALLADNAAGGDGGGIALLDSSSLLVGDGAKLRGNRAKGSGGCLYSGGAGARLCQFFDFLQGCASNLAMLQQQKSSRH